MFPQTSSKICAHCKYCKRGFKKHDYKCLHPDAVDIIIGEAISCADARMGVCGEGILFDGKANESK